MGGQQERRVERDRGGEDSGDGPASTQPVRTPNSTRRAKRWVLPPTVMGNSEVGHLTIGAGRVIYQDLMRITKAIESGAFARNPAIVDAIKKTVANGTTLHIWGLLSDGSVHSHN